MKNWLVVFWLMAFFPVGLYLMFKKTEWSIRKKYIVSGITLFIYGLSILIGGFDNLLMMSGVITFFAGIVAISHSLIKKRNRKVATGILFLGFFLFAFGANQVEANNKEKQAEEQRIVLEKQVKEKEEFNKQKEQQKKELAEQHAKEERLEKEKNLQHLKEAQLAVEKAEQESSRENYDKAFTLVSTLAISDSDLEGRLIEVEKTVILEAKKIEETEVAVKSAEENKTRESYNNAVALVSSLKYANSSFSDRLAQTEKSIVAEEERVATEKAAKAEEERIAAEQVQQEKVLAEQASQAAVATPSSNSGELVWIAPQSGTKYHYNQHCRGLNNANSTNQVSLSDAQNQGYTLCGWED